MSVTTDGNHTYVVVETPLPGPNKKWTELLNEAAKNPPELWYTPNAAGGGLNFKLILMAGALAVGAILLIKRGK
jgi:hypothetical protein